MSDDRDSALGNGRCRVPNAECRIPGPDLGLYIHLPFCAAKCAYCDFASFPLASLGGLPAARRYLDALAVEMDRRAGSEEFAGVAVSTVYLGGGTPTALPAEWIGEVLARLRARFALSPGAEISVEANPGTVDREKLAVLRAAGANRISLGVQSFRDDELRLLGRIHTAAEAAEALALAREAGFDNVSLDLIYGLPGQRVEAWRESLGQAVALSPEHISCYGLSLEEGTPLAQAVKCRELPAPEEEPYAEMYALAGEALTAAGYEHYEISNFSRPGRPCRHNRGYWSGGEYLGLGNAAHSHRGGIRWNNLPDLAVYCDEIEQGRLPVARAEALSARARVGELLMLGLRTADGVAEEEVAARCGLAPREVFGDVIAELVERGMLVAAQGRLRVPRAQWLVSNEVLAEFVDSESCG